VGNGDCRDETTDLDAPTRDAYAVSLANVATSQASYRLSLLSPYTRADDRSAFYGATGATWWTYF